MKGFTPILLETAIAEGVEALESGWITPLEKFGMFQVERTARLDLTLEAGTEVVLEFTGPVKLNGRYLSDFAGRVIATIHVAESANA